MTDPAASGRTAIVVGGGFVGAACAWNLVRAGFRTRLVDMGDTRLAASFGNAGHVAIEQVDPLASYAVLRSLPCRLFAFGGPVGLPFRELPAWLPFGLRLVAAAGRFAEGKRALGTLLSTAMPAWNRLVDATETRALLRADGHYVTWESSGTAARGRRAWLEADIGEASVADATKDELDHLRHLFAGRPIGALRFRKTGQIVDISAMREGLGRAFANAGGVRVVDTAVRIDIQAERASVVLESGETLAADAIVIAAGIGSAKLMRGLAGPVPLIAERGYHVEADLPAESWPTDMPPVAFEDRSVIVTRFASTLRLAGFTEFARPDASPDTRKWMRLEQHAGELGLPSGSGGRRWFGARPTLPDYLPAIGRSNVAGNLLYAFGHQHLGVTLAAITGEIVSALAAGSTTAIDTAPFDLGRFR